MKVTDIHPNYASEEQRAEALSEAAYKLAMLAEKEKREHSTA